MDIAQLQAAHADTLSDTLGTPHDITAQELRIEAFFPADESTEAATRRLRA